MKKVVKLFLFFFLVLSLTGCSEKLTAPDITGTDEDVAKNILLANGLIPNVNYEYSDDIQREM